MGVLGGVIGGAIGAGLGAIGGGILGGINNNKQQKALREQLDNQKKDIEMQQKILNENWIDYNNDFSIQNQNARFQQQTGANNSAVSSYLQGKNDILQLSQQIVTARSSIGDRNQATANSGFRNSGSLEKAGSIQTINANKAVELSTESTLYAMTSRFEEARNSYLDVDFLMERYSTEYGRQNRTYLQNSAQNEAAIYALDKAIKNTKKDEKWYSLSGINAIFEGSSKGAQTGAATGTTTGLIATAIF